MKHIKRSYLLRNKSSGEIVQLRSILDRGGKSYTYIDGTLVITSYVIYRIAIAGFDVDLLCRHSDMLGSDQ